MRFCTKSSRRVSNIGPCTSKVLPSCKSRRHGDSSTRSLRDWGRRCSSTFFWDKLSSRCRSQFLLITANNNIFREDVVVGGGSWISGEGEWTPREEFSDLVRFPLYMICKLASSFKKWVQFPCIAYRLDPHHVGTRIHPLSSQDGCEFLRGGDRDAGISPRRSRTPAE